MTLKAQFVKILRYDQSLLRQGLCRTRQIHSVQQFLCEVLHISMLSLRGSLKVIAVTFTSKTNQTIIAHYNETAQLITQALVPCIIMLIPPVVILYV